MAKRSHASSSDSGGPSSGSRTTLRGERRASKSAAFAHSVQPPAETRPDGHAGPGGIDLPTTEALARLMAECELSEVELTRGSDRLRLTRGGSSLPHLFSPPAAPGLLSPLIPPTQALSPAPPSVAAPGVAAIDSAAVDKGGSLVASPFVGTFYRAPSAESPPFVEVGQRVKKGQVVCLVEAMKLMNEIETEVEGTIAAILVDNGQSVEYGEPLFRLTP